MSDNSLKVWSKCYRYFPKILKQAEQKYFNNKDKIGEVIDEWLKKNHVIDVNDLKLGDRNKIEL